MLLVTIEVVFDAVVGKFQSISSKQQRVNMMHSTCQNRGGGSSLRVVRLKGESKIADRAGPEGCSDSGGQGAYPTGNF